MLIRRAAAGDDDAIWAIMEPILRDGETYALPRDTDKKTALGYWRSPEHEDFVAEENGEIVGTYFLRANQKGGGGHVANCGYMTAASATGRGVARAMCAQRRAPLLKQPSCIRSWRHARRRPSGLLAGNTCRQSRRFLPPRSPHVRRIASRRGQFSCPCRGAAYRFHHRGGS